jgi:23S rRNA pseudouridine2605 synthase
MWSGSGSHYLLNAAGVVTTALIRRPPTVGLVPDNPVFLVGRPDADRGPALLTNDGDSRTGWHRVRCREGVHRRGRGPSSRGAIRRLREGVDLDDGRTAPATVALVEPTVLRIVIHEGRNRQVRRMCDAIGHPVVRLVRTRIGPLRDPSLRPGTWRRIASARSNGRVGRRIGSSAVPRAVRALRGATTVDEDTPEQVTERVTALLKEMFARNDVHHDDLISILFTATEDISSIFPATAARTIGLGDVPLMCAREIPAGSMPR